MNTRRYAILLLVSILCAVGGILTLIPRAGATYENVMGYRSLCTFAPAATLYCFAAAGITCVLRASLVKRAAYSGGKPSFKVVPIVVVLIVLCLGIVANLWFANVKATYTDGVSAVTEQT